MYPTSFKTRSPFDVGDNFGSGYGVYIHNDPEIARAKCLTGLELKLDQFTVDVDNGVLFEYDCSFNGSCNALPIVG